MRSDPIIEEVWRNKDEYARRHDYDLSKICADLRRRQVLNPKRIVDRRCTKNDAAADSTRKVPGREMADHE